MRRCQISFSIRAFAFRKLESLLCIREYSDAGTVMSKAKKAEEAKKKKLYYEKKEKKAKEVKK
jgi:hypothetical protein